VIDAVEMAIYNPLHDILTHYSTKCENTIELEHKIIRCIDDLNEKYLKQPQQSSSSTPTNTKTQPKLQLPQSIFHLGFESPSKWRDCVVKLQQIEHTKSPTEMLVQLLSTVHSIHSTYFIECKATLINKDPPPLGADDFLPILVYVTACANLSKPQTMFQTIAQLANRDRLEGLAKYFLTVFESALWFLSRGTSNFTESKAESEEDIKQGKEREDTQKQHDQKQQDNIDIKGVMTNKGNSSKNKRHSNALTGRQETQRRPLRRSLTTGDSSVMDPRIEFRLHALERRMVRMSGRLIAVDRMLQLNSMSVESTERRGSLCFIRSLAPIQKGRHVRTVSEEVVEARQTCEW